MMSILTIAAISYFASLTFASKTANFITYGRDAKPHSAPYIVSIHTFEPGLEPGTLVCGGSILNRNYVLTAGHCVLTRIKNPHWLKVYAGRHDLRLTDKDEDGETRIIKKIFVHEKYTKMIIASYDIALAKLAEPFIFTNIIKPIRLAPAHETQKGESTLFGWGSTSTSWPLVFPSVLQTVNLSLLSYKKCEEIVKHYKFRWYPTFICTDGYGNSGICEGDCGGPLVQYIKDGKPLLIGVASWIAAVNCGTNNAPSIYTKVSDFIDWIIFSMH